MELIKIKSKRGNIKKIERKEIKEEMIKRIEMKQIGINI